MCVCVSDHDECEEESCVGGVCVNTVGSYYCSCQPPLVLDDTQRNCVNSSHLTVGKTPAFILLLLLLIDFLFFIPLRCLLTTCTTSGLLSPPHLSNPLSPSPLSSSKLATVTAGGELFSLSCLSHGHRISEAAGLSLRFDTNVHLDSRMI